MLNFVKTIQDNKDKIGVAQYFGKFRAYSFEEYLFRLIQARVAIPKDFGVFWGEKCLAWKKEDQEYRMELDVVIGKKSAGVVEPKVVVDAKVELDASRLKTTLASFVILKRQFPKAKCFLVYMFGTIDSLLLDLTKPLIDGIYQFSRERNEVAVFIESVQNILEKA